MLRFKSLGSGSAGNATLVEASSGLSRAGPATRTTRVLVDCGFGVRVMETRLAQAGVAIDEIDAIFITHEHSDHVGGAAAFSKRCNTPVWMSQGTWAGARKPEFGDRLHIAMDNVAIQVGNLQLVPFAVPHDAHEPLQLRCSNGQRQLGILTDLGHATESVLRHLRQCQALLLEFNHDSDLLQQGGYPAFLKKRVSGQLGHLSNADAAQIAAAVNHAGMGPVVAAHLSRQNNRPGLVRAALSQALGRLPHEVDIADQATGCGWTQV